MNQPIEATFPVRNVEFEITGETPKYWHSQRRAVTIFFNNLSTLFPEGEKFFIKSLLLFKKQVDDPQLQAEIRAFCGQEGMHTREHIRYNNMLKDQGYDVEGIERGVKWLLVMTHRLFTPRMQLAVSSSLEHWTAMLAHFVLADTTILDDADPVMAGLWRWHAAEECEHKAVTFDVYERVGGTYVVRCGVQLATSLVFWFRVIQQQWLMMRSDGIQWSVREWFDLAKFLFAENRIMQRLFPIWLEYFDPRFHPWHLEDSHLITQWKIDYESNPVYKKRVKKQPKVRPAPAA